jgi:hypothetical protein
MNNYNNTINSYICYIINYTITINNYNNDSKNIYFYYNLISKGNDKK